MLNREGNKVTYEDIYLVQNYIEQCLQRHMNLNEVKNTLLVKAKINPEFTELAWKKLEGDNKEFFKAYNLRLLVKDQIIQFNRLLERQAELTSQLSAGPTAVHMSNGSHIPQTFNGQAYTGSALQSEYMHQPFGYSNGGSSSGHPCMQATVDASENARNINVSSSMLFGSSNMLVGQSSNEGMVQGINGEIMNSDIIRANGGSSSVHQCMQATVDASNNARNINVSSSMLLGSYNMLVGQSSNEGLVQGMNGGIMNSDIFGLNGDVLDARHVAGDMHVSQPNNTLLATDASCESLGMIPRSSSLSDYTTDLFHDILEYPESPFLATGSGNLLNPHYQGEQQDNRSLDTISKGLNYDDFGGK